MHEMICIPVNEMTCIRISELQLLTYIQKYAGEYGFLWWHNDRNVFRYWLAHQTIWKGKSSPEKPRVTPEDFDIKEDVGPCLVRFLNERLGEN